LIFLAGILGMIPMTMIGKVRRMFHRQNKSVREIARLTSLSRNTIRKYLKADVQEEPKYQRKAKPTREAGAIS
jgi:transposase